MDVFRVYCLTLILLLVTTTKGNRIEYKPPRIFPKGRDYTVALNGNVTFRCEGKNPISWKIANYSTYGQLEPKYSTITINSSETSDSEYIYGSILTLQNATYMDVGYYHCLEETENLNDLYKVSDIYLYVDDPKHLSVLPQYPNPIIVRQYTEVILPCRSTSPNVTVTLSNYADLQNIISFRENSDGQFAVFYRQKGFIMTKFLNTGRIFYECKFSRNNLEQTSVLLLIILPSNATVAKPEDTASNPTDADVQQKCSETNLMDIGSFLAATVNEFRSAPRRIFPAEKEFLIAPNSNFTLICEGKKPVTWKFPNNSLNGEVELKFSTVIVNSSEKPDSEYAYSSILTIQNASYLDVGLYYCFEESIDLEDLSKDSSVYVYVDDPENLSLLPKYPNEIIIPQNFEAVLPCRPTSPNVNVTLWNYSDQEEIVLEKPEAGCKKIMFDPQRGFIINQFFKIDRIFYECRFSRNNLQQTSSLVLYTLQPSLQETFRREPMVGNKLTLRCTVRLEIKTQLRMEWIIPSKEGVANGRIKISKTVSMPRNTYYQELVIKEATIEDKGEYVCVVKDYNQETYTKKFVQVFHIPD